MSPQDLILQVAALVCFAVAAAPVPTRGVQLGWLGLFFQTLTLFV